MIRPRLTSRAVLALALTAAPLAAQTPAAATAAVRRPAAALPTKAVRYDRSLFDGLKFRMVGPARGGRVTAIAGVPSQPRTFYMGSTGGGIWKTTDAGTTWQNISDGQLPVGSMGALDVALSDPNIIYAGTGSSKIRSNVSIGRGMFKSTDAGRSWKFSGLRDVGQIATIRTSPTDPNLVYVAAQGNPFVPNVDRGVYRSTDGGANWKKILYVTDSTGATDIEFQPGNPRTIYAAMWHGVRRPWTIISGANEGGIYKSTDGGDSWTKLGGGLPTGIVGRSNIGVSKADPMRLYVLIEAKPGGGLYRSNDAGATWTLVNGAQNLWTRPFYYTTLGVDPNNADIVYVGNEGWFKSTDGGKSFRNAPVPHGDNHDVWINPNDSRYMIQSNDGGANVSLDGGATWSTQYNQPTAELYQVAVDDQFPYRIYGAQQDNSTLIVPSLPLGSGQAEEWRTGPGCETGPIIPAPDNPDVVYGSCKGQFSRMNLKSGDEQQYWVGAQSLYGNGGAELIYRFQRVSPMEISPWDPKVVYYGSQYVHRTRDGGVTWTKISPDLTAFPPGEPQQASGWPITRDATGEEVYSTLYSIRESPVAKGVIWTGSNDGPIWVTKDDGKTWANVTPKGLPSGGRVQNIEPSPHRAGAAYAAEYRFLLGDFKPYVYGTEDYGATWTLLTDGTNGIAADEPTRVVREDPSRPGLLYVGTEMGMYLSFDNGRSWQSFQLNLPHTPVTDIRITHKDMVLSTMGRSFWVMDNLTPLHQIDEKIAAAPATLYTPNRAIRMKIRGGGGFGRGAGAQYPTAGAQIDYYIAKAPSSEITLDVLDAKGALIKRFTSAAPAAGPVEAAPAADDEEGGPRRGGPAARVDKTPGMHRFTWDLRYPGPWQSERVPESGNGPQAVPGTYQVRLTVDGVAQTKSFTLIEDPRVTKDGVTQADLVEQFQHNMKVRDLVSEVNKTIARVRKAQTALKDDAPKLQQVDGVAKQLITPPIRYSKPELQAHITYLYSMTTGADQKIGRDAIERFEVLKKELGVLVKQLNVILGPTM
jgi:photosystem II stability/assembly factor-like uncharacterized protein